MFDTHSHLNFKAFKKTLTQVIEESFKAGVRDILIPGTDLKTSKRAYELACTNPHLYASAGIHPHHVFDIYIKVKGLDEDATVAYIEDELKEISILLKHNKVVAVGEIGLDRHIYLKTKYAEYEVTDAFVEVQKRVLIAQLQLALQYNKSIIFHNRESADDLLSVLSTHWNEQFSGKSVFHCCEANDDLLAFAVKHKVYIGVDGDITYGTHKDAFIKAVPLDHLVIETDAPFLLPEPLRSEKKYPNTSANLTLIAEKVAFLKKISLEELIRITTENSNRLFQITERSNS